MTKKIIFPILILILFGVFFIPLTEQKSVWINSSFFNIYTQVAKPQNWGKWRMDLKKIDSNKFSISTYKNSFSIKYLNDSIKVNQIGSQFNIVEVNNNKILDYSYFLIPDKFNKKTLLSVNYNSNVGKYVMNYIFHNSPSNTHEEEFKNYMETDSLFYGFNIMKSKVPGANLIVSRKQVINKNKFVEASKILASLNLFLKEKGLKKTAPLIAQFIDKGTDSCLVNIGFYIDKEVKSSGDINFERMPKGGPLYIANYEGSFYKRKLVYNTLQNYFNNHLLQQGILPFETYYNDKLPVSDTDKVKIRVNFSSY